MNKIKFFSKEDLNVYYDQARLRDLISQTKFNEELIDILEYHNINKYIKNDCVFYDGYEEDVNSYSKVINMKMGNFFGNRSLDEVKKDFDCLFNVIKDDSKFLKESSDNETKNALYRYREDYIECFDIYNVSKKVESSELKSIISHYDIPIRYFLKSKSIVKFYDNLLKEYFLSDLKNFELLIGNYRVNSVGYYIPQSISKEEMYEFASLYINSNNANLNTLKMINNGIKGLKELHIDEHLKLSSENRIKELSKRGSFNKEETTSFSTMLKIYKEIHLYEADNKNYYKSLVDVEWMEKYSDPASLLNLLVSTNLLFNESWILNLCYFPNKDDSVFKILSNNSKNHYENNLDFKIKQVLMLQTFKYFQLSLNDRLEISIENLIYFFFFDYLYNEFSINWLPMTFPHQEINIKIKIQNLFVLDEAIKKQWNMYVKNSELNHGLYKYVSTPKADELQSLLKFKYIYLNKENKDFIYFTFLLFSKQSGLSYIDSNLSEENFVSLTDKFEINLSQLHEYQKPKINQLVEVGLISLSEEGFIFLNDNQRIRIIILQSIYYNGVINYHYQFTGFSSGKTNIFKQEIIKMISEKILININSLLSIPEQEYLNFLLNDRNYDNSLGLRNKYQHAGELNEVPDDYYYGLIIVILYINKINEELILSNKI